MHDIKASHIFGVRVWWNTYAYACFRDKWICVYWTVFCALYARIWPEPAAMTEIVSNWTKARWGRGGDGRRTHNHHIDIYICALDAIQWHWITENTLIEIEILSSSQRLSLSSVSPPSANNTLYIWKHEQQRRLLHIHGKNNIAMSEWASCV